MSVPFRLPLLALGFLTACGPVVNKDTVVLEKLPADVQTGQATQAVLTSEGNVFGVPASGGFVELKPDAGAWEEVSGPAMKRFVVNFKDTQTLAEGQSSAPGLFVAKGHGFVAVEPAVPALTHAAFQNASWSTVKGRDAQGTWWSVSPPSFGQFDGKQSVAHFDVGASDWVVDEVPLADPAHTTFAAAPVMTSDARFFFRPTKFGLFEIDLANHQMVERVPCSAELFNGACDAATTFLFAGRDGVLFIFSAAHELWRIGSRETTATRVVKGALPSLPGDAGPLATPSFYVDPAGRVWLAFTSGAASFLYEAEPKARDSWTFISSTLPAALTLFGDGPLPILSNEASSAGLLVYRVTLR
ncbi:MAG: hypothetical protein U0228_30510 [Myxococcaceae bacterium]